MTQEIACYGTVWIAPLPGDDGAPPQSRPPPGALHMTSPGLNWGFMRNLFLHTTGKTFREYLNAAMDTRDAEESALRRLEGPSRLSPLTYHLYDCRERFCQAVAALTERRIQEISANWIAAHSRAIQPSPAMEPPAHRLAVLNQIVQFARTAVARGTCVRLRVDYRAKHSGRSPPRSISG